MKSRIRWMSVSVAAIAGGLILGAAGMTEGNIGLGTTTAPAPTTAPDVSSAATVEIDNFNFKPRELTVKVGATVTWANHDDVPHTATGKGKSPAFDSKMLDTDDKFSFTFKKAGTYAYYCKVHPHMTATIVVK